jgi:hypothetical protein
MCLGKELRKYQGIGIFAASGMPAIKGNFTLQFEDTGKYVMSLIPENQIDALKYVNLPVIMGKFVGTSSQPYFEIEIETIYLNNVHLGAEKGGPLKVDFSFQIFSPIKVLFTPMNPADTVEFRRGISNLLFWGTEIIQQGSQMVRGKITWKLAGNDITLEQIPTYDDAIKHLTKFNDVAVTCELKMAGTYNQLAIFQEITENLQNLFSLASANFNTTIYEDIYFNGQLSASTLFPLKTYIFSNRLPLIDCSMGHEFKDFLDVTYQNYINLRVNLGLSYFVEFFTTSKMYSPMEAEYILSTTAFECLESYFRNWQELPEAHGGLKGKISRMCNHFRFTTTDAELERYRICRNSLTHEGKFPAGSDKIALLMELRNIMDRFVLTILGYRNKPYYNAITRKKAIMP